MEQTGFNVLIDQSAGLERGIEANSWLRPQQASVEVLVDLGLDSLVLDGDERGDVVLIVVHHSLPELKYVHDSPFGDPVPLENPDFYGNRRVFEVSEAIQTQTCT